VGRTARAGARGTASTFALKSERADIARIERMLSIRLKRCAVAAGITQEVKHSAPVIEIPPAPRGARRWQTFAPKRHARRAV
jgi:ATP-dependent RNA helicase RhlE